MAERRVAVFVDAENIPASAADDIMAEAARHGRPTARRLYGDFTRPQLAAWLEAAPRNALTSCQTAGGAAGKNGADIALVIDAMETLCGGAADVFCIASSDGDFTQLAMRIRQSGKTIVGFGQPKASLRFQAACDIFVVLKGKKIVGPAVPRPLKPDLLKKVFDATTPSTEGAFNLPDLMKSLKTLEPTFRVKDYGHSQFCKLLAFSGVKLTDRNSKARPRLS